jgi:DMSO/TMAO reductase YedYZ heme-binding membrane subunit
MTPTLGEAPYWYLTRSTGVVAFVLLTVTLALGVAATQRALATPAWPRFATQGLHRNVSLLGLAFLGAHVTTTVLDSFVDLSGWSAFAPGASHYRTTWVALGTTAFDLTLLVVVSSLVRTRLPVGVWRGVHLSAYLAWPLAWLHFLRTGTDAVQGRFGFWVAIGCAAVVGLAAGVRIALPDKGSTQLQQG